MSFAGKGSGRHRGWSVMVLILVLICLFGCDRVEDVPQTVPPTTLPEVELTLNGQKEITLEYGQDFADPGADAVAAGADVPIKVEGTVDTQVLGVYTLTYVAEYQGVSKEVTRTVFVVDTTAPEITLVSDPEGFTIPGMSYEEEGYRATDACDGDLTDRVQCRQEEGSVYYTVSDSSGNVAEVVRKIRYHDPIAPELTLEGESAVTLTAGQKWSEPGYTAMDNVDGNITGQVKVSGKVNTNTAGTYVIVYEVTDSYGNSASVSRTVVVKKQWQPEQVKPNGKVIYLTFDDGPWENTDKLLSILKKYDVKVTFFVVNNTKYISLLKDMADDGHTVAIHSKTHRYNEIYASDEAFLKDLYDMQNIILQQTGKKTTVMRFPGGSSNGVSKKYNVGIMSRLIKTVESLGFQYFDWNVDSDDAGSASTWQEVYQNVIDGVKQKDYSVVLMHDTRNYTIEAVEKIIQWGLDNGYTFQALEPSSPACHHDWVKN